ncbi:MAG: FMN-binding protein [Clostridia bacterium]
MLIDINKTHTSTKDVKKFGSLQSKWIMLFFLVVIVVALNACGQMRGPTENELSALNKIFGQDYKEQDLKIITEEVMTSERQDKFKAVCKVFTTPKGDYAFIVKPIAYNGPITLAVGIDKETEKTIGIRIIEHMETEHYVRDMDNSWFTDRFTEKQTDSYLKAVHLEADNNNEIVIITGATITTEGIVNGVNACMGVFQEYELKQNAEKVPYMVKFEKEAKEVPLETSKVEIRAYGVTLGEVSLEDIRKMPSVKRTMSIHSTSGTSNHSFRGTLLSNVFAAVDSDLTSKYESVQSIGVDDYLSSISMEEVLAENSVFLMYEDNGKPLAMKSGEPGAMRVVVLDDVFGQRFTNYLREINLE